MQLKHSNICQAEPTAPTMLPRFVSTAWQTKNCGIDWLKVDQSDCDQIGLASKLHSELFVAIPL